MKLNNKGFTLVEILAVIVILSLLVGIAIPSVLSGINTSKEASYDIMISNIVTASGSLYEEINYSGSSLYKYNLDGTHTELIASAPDGSISINLQTLVSNGFLMGSNNDCDDASCLNQNKKILLNPKSKKDIGKCNIKIQKDGSKYKVENNDTNTDCPSEYKKEVK